MKRILLCICTIFCGQLLSSQVRSYVHDLAEEFSHYDKTETVYKDLLSGFGLYLSTPEHFDVECRYGACINPKNFVGQEYILCYKSKDNNCLVFFPAIRRNSPFSLQDIISFDYFNRESEKKHITTISGGIVEDYFNADSITYYTLPPALFFDDFYNDEKDLVPLKRFTHSCRFIVQKKGKTVVPLLYLFTDKGYTKRESYIKDFIFHMYFIKAGSFIQ